MENRTLFAIKSILFVYGLRLSSFASAMPVAQLQVRTQSFVSRVCCYDYEIARAEPGCSAHKNEPGWGSALPKNDPARSTPALPKIEIPSQCVLEVEGNHVKIKRECVSDIKFLDDRDHQNLLQTLIFNSGDKPEVTLVINDPC